MTMHNDLPYEQVLVFGNMRADVFYRTPQWKRARYLALTTLGNRCQLCGSGPASGPLHVDHILPRSRHPERCLDTTNLQVLCEPCHTAKGVVFVDDCRRKLTREARALRDFFRIERRHLLLEHRAPTCAEAKLLGEGARTASKKHRTRWRLFVKFCAFSGQTYAQAARVTVGEFLQSPWAANHQYQKFLQHGGNGAKGPQERLFDIDGCPLPSGLGALLADDQKGAAL